MLVLKLTIEPILTHEANFRMYKFILNTKLCRIKKFCIKHIPINVWFEFTILHEDARKVFSNVTRKKLIFSESNFLFIKLYVYSKYILIWQIVEVFFLCILI